MLVNGMNLPLQSVTKVGHQHRGNLHPEMVLPPIYDVKTSTAVQIKNTVTLKPGKQQKTQDSLLRYHS